MRGLSVRWSISLSRYVMSVSDGSSWAAHRMGGAPAATDDGRSCGQACQAVSGEWHTAALAKANLLPVQRPRPGGNECHDSVTGLPTPLRVLCRLTRGNRQPCHPAGGWLQPAWLGRKLVGGAAPQHSRPHGRTRLDRGTRRGERSELAPVRGGLPCARHPRRLHPCARLRAATAGADGPAVPRCPRPDHPDRSRRPVLTHSGPGEPPAAAPRQGGKAQATRRTAGIGICQTSPTKPTRKTADLGHCSSRAAREKRRRARRIGRFAVCWPGLARTGRGALS